VECLDYQIPVPQLIIFNINTSSSRGKEASMYRFLSTLHMYLHFKLLSTDCNVIDDVFARYIRA